MQCEPWAEGKHISKLDALKAQIESLVHDEFAEIFRWLSEKNWEMWDKEFEADSQVGRLDLLVCEAGSDKAKGKLKDL